mmetsp:Transcript_99047/g.319309  ORF Transcript_99047/g.319309 Transcript_99047/m.319309 type:complete len:221 (-) Transcript_99047:693-1355(-)
MPARSFHEDSNALMQFGRPLRVNPKLRRDPTTGPPRNLRNISKDRFGHSKRHLRDLNSEAMAVQAALFGIPQRGVGPKVNDISGVGIAALKRISGLGQACRVDTCTAKEHVQPQDWLPGGPQGPPESNLQIDWFISPLWANPPFGGCRHEMNTAGALRRDGHHSALSWPRSSNSFVIWSICCLAWLSSSPPKRPLPPPPNFLFAWSLISMACLSRYLSYS